MKGHSYRAEVQWWDDSNIYVRCPDCQRIHRHGFNGRYKPPERRLSHCFPYADDLCCCYTIIFPFDEGSGEIGYEIDKQRAIFVSTRADPSEYDKALEEDGSKPTSDDYKHQKKWTDANEKVQIIENDSLMIERIVLVVSDLVCGRVREVRDYLESSKDADIFLHGVEARRFPRLPGNDYDSGSEHDDTEEADVLEDEIEVTGNTALHLAACESSSEMVQLLLQKGANPNAINMAGRSPLMEAALWGRSRNVELLLDNGADKEVSCVRDGRPLQAADFARPLRNNVEERHSRSGGVYIENTYERDRDRLTIVRLLSEDLEERELAHHVPSSFMFHRSPEEPTSLALIHTFDMLNQWKTVALLYRGARYAPVAAMSGWAHQEESNVQVSGRNWTEEVRQLCQRVGHSLPPSEKDQGWGGKYHACHAEKQLIAFFVHKHLFLPGETEEEVADFAQLCLEELSDDLYETQEARRYHRERLSRLKEVEPPITLKQGTILVSRPCCEDCSAFLACVNLKLGLCLKLHHYCTDSVCELCSKLG